MFDDLMHPSTAPEQTCRRADFFSHNNSTMMFIIRKRSIKPSATTSSINISSADSEKFVQNEIIVGDREGGNEKRHTSCSHQSISVIGRRREMEDTVAIQLGFLKRGKKKYDFFGVFDGHGGSRVAHACRERLHGLVVKRVEEEEENSKGIINWEEVMTASFRSMDEEVNNNGGSSVAMMGSTAVVAVVGEEELVVANCGDSRAVLCRDGVAVPLSEDHKPDRPDELERIEVSGGKVINWNGERVLGVLATSRSIGDKYLKPYVIAEPEVRVCKRSDKDEFMILASDGLWDVISSDTACKIVKRSFHNHKKISNNRDFAGVARSRTARAAALLAKLAMARGSGDNISVIVIQLSDREAEINDTY